MEARGAGFTIVEVMIFLAISGLLLTMMLIGTGTMAARQRFTDTVDSLQSYVQSQYDEVVNGLNPRTDNTECDSMNATSVGTSGSQCLLLGKILTFNGTTVSSSYVISTQGLGGQTTDQAKFQAAQLKVVGSAASSYELKWGAKITRATRAGSVPRGVADTAAFLRLPDSERIVALYYSGGTTTALRATVSSAGNYATALNPSASDTEPSFSVCVKNVDDLPVNTPVAAIYFGQGLGASSIDANYHPVAAVCP